MARKIIHVAQDAIRRNMKTGAGDPPVILNIGGKPERFHAVRVYDPNGHLVGTFKYSPDKPLSCGARVWFELEDGCSARGVADPLEWV